MCPSPSSPQNPPVTTSDEHHVRSIKSLLHTSNSAEQVTRSQPNSPLSSAQLPASPTTPISSSRYNSTPMSTIQSTVQPNNCPMQNSTAMSISINSNPPCLMLPEPTLRSDQPAETLSQPLDPSSVESLRLSPKFRQSITPSFSFPGASSSVTTYDRIFPNTAESQYTLSDVSSTEFIPTISQRTPNVYINGLPPHFSERDLFALVRPFGDITSVRTFTRHVSEKPTGYGFVLFDDVESAQRCIDGLRKHRNLHPSFSKRVHRIPGTEYAQHIAVQSTDLDVNSFKSRMEKLQDTTSSNLYIEGLPLSTDEESLAALVRPYKIKSSRFFKTKLSNPPRIIAFVRLETRATAEETIERLHGRMVRGWNDPGCRISVRFADSAEQRELRRTERTLKNGDQSPSRLTIAEAALLNLRGQDLQTNTHDIEIPKSQRLATLHSDSQATFHTLPDFGLLPVSRSLPSNLRYTHKESPLPSVSDVPISEMDSLLQSIQNMGYEGRALDDTMRNLALNNEYLVSQQAHLRVLASAALLSPNPLVTTLPRGHTQARNGFTPAEELILETHAQRLQLHGQLSQSRSMPMPSLRRINENVQIFDSALPEPPQASMVTGNSRDTLPTISEDDFHAMGHLPRSFVRTGHNFQGVDDRYPAAVPLSMNVEFVRPPSRAVSIVAPPPDYEEPEKRGKGYHQRAERLIGSRQNHCPSSPFNTRQIIPSAELKSHPSLLRSSTRPNNINGTHNGDHNNPISNSRDKNIHTYTYLHGDARSCPEEDKGARFRSSSASQIYSKKFPQLGGQNPTVKAGPKSPVVISPALTYSSRTPSTLSPATPFFGSFAGSPDTVDVMTMENEDMAERRLKGRIANK